jgi:hypothetical protein
MNGALNKWLLADEGTSQGKDGCRKASVINGHHDVKIFVSILQELDFDLILLRIEFHYICLKTVQFGDELVTGHG